MGERLFDDLCGDLYIGGNKLCSVASIPEFAPETETEKEEIALSIDTNKDISFTFKLPYNWQLARIRKTMLRFPTNKGPVREKNTTKAVQEMGKRARQTIRHMKVFEQMDILPPGLEWPIDLTATPCTDSIEYFMWLLPDFDYADYHAEKVKRTNRSKHRLRRCKKAL